MGTWTVGIPGWHPRRVNEWDGRHWASRSRAKKSDRQVVALCCLAARVPPASCRRRVTLTITLGPRQRGADPDSYWKSLLDALVACGALRDDRKEWVELAPVRYDRGPARASRITLEDL